MSATPSFGKQDFPSRGQLNAFNRGQWNYFWVMQRGTLRRTKIIATLGPATDSAEMIGKLIDAGVNVFRLNMSHAPHDWVRRVVKDIRAAAAARKQFVGIMMDTQGPAIRTGELGVPLDLQPGQKFTLTVRGEHERGRTFGGRELRKFHQRHQRRRRGAHRQRRHSDEGARQDRQQGRMRSPHRTASSAAAGTSICPASKSACPRSPPRTSRT